MKIRSYFCSTLLICLLGLSAHGQQESLDGHWQGALVRDGAVQLIMVDFFKDAQALKASIEIPDLVISEPSIVT